MKHNKVFIYGKHAVSEALEHAPHSISKVFLAPGQGDADLRKLIRQADVPVAELRSGGRARDMGGSEAHQGIIGALIISQLVRPYEEFIRDLKVTPDMSLVLLGEIKDPQNVGAIIRSAAAFGASGILMPKHNQAPITGSVVKVSAGMVFRVPIVEVGNMNMTVRDLKDRGFTVYGLEGDAKMSVTDASYDGPSAFIMGNEEKGIRAKTAELCDTLLAIPMHPRTESLNVAASAAVVLHAWSTKHPKALQ